MNFDEFKQLGLRLFQETVGDDLNKLYERPRERYRRLEDFEEICVALAVLYCKLYHIEIPCKES